MKREITKEVRKAVAEEYHKNKHRKKEIAEKYGVSVSSVWKWEKDLVNGTLGKKTGHEKYELDFKMKVVLYHLNGHFLKETAEKFGVSKDTVANWTNLLYHRAMNHKKKENQPEQKTLKWVRAGAGSGYWK